MKTKADFLKEREEMIGRLIGSGFLRSSSIVEAMRKVPREEFMPKEYVDYAYLEAPVPILGDGMQIILCPSYPTSYPVFYEALELGPGDRFLEVGTGSGYGAALAREIIGKEGMVVSIEINEVTFRFAEGNLRRLGYNDIILVRGDGAMGYEMEAPYTKVSVTADSPMVPPPLIEQLAAPGRLVSPVGRNPDGSQDMILVRKGSDGMMTQVVDGKVLYTLLTGRYGWRNL
ncbi:MAG: protein-L-isoaspartate O-methyltransferase [Anaerolineae bacterium]